MWVRKAGGGNPMVRFNVSLLEDCRIGSLVGLSGCWAGLLCQLLADFCWLVGMAGWHAGCWFLVGWQGIALDES